MRRLPRVSVAATGHVGSQPAVRVVAPPCESCRWPAASHAGDRSTVAACSAAGGAGAGGRSTAAGGGGTDRTRGPAAAGSCRRADARDVPLASRHACGGLVVGGGVFGRRRGGSRRVRRLPRCLWRRPDMWAAAGGSCCRADARNVPLAGRHSDERGVAARWAVGVWAVRRLLGPRRPTRWVSGRGGPLGVVGGSRLLGPSRVLARRPGASPASGGRCCGGGDAGEVSVRSSLPSGSVTCGFARHFKVPTSRWGVALPE